LAECIHCDSLSKFRLLKASLQRSITPFGVPSGREILFCPLSPAGGDGHSASCTEIEAVHQSINVTFNHQKFKHRFKEGDHNKHDSSGYDKYYFRVCYLYWDLPSLVQLYKGGWGISEYAMLVHRETRNCYGMSIDLSLPYKHYLPSGWD
jgi:hypothetical protein